MKPKLLNLGSRSPAELIFMHESHLATNLVSRILEMSLLQSRNRRVHEVVEFMYNEAKNPQQQQGSKKAIDATIDVIINVKKIKRDLHIQ